MFIWRRGSTFQIALTVTGGTVTGSEPIRAQMKPALPDNSPPPDDTPASVTFSSTWDAGGSRWVFTGAADDSLPLPIGNYVSDVRLVLNGLVVQSAPVVIQLVDRVTEPAA